MNPSDENLKGVGLNQFSKNFSNLRNEVIATWKLNLKIDRRTTTASKEQLIDTFPIIFDNLVQALTPGYPRELATSGTNLAQSHGMERANAHFYSASDLVDELQKFRTSVFSVCAKNNIQLDDDQAKIISTSFDTLVIESLSAFSIQNSHDNDFFIATFTHDLRDPLHTANASAQLIKLQTNKNTIVKLAKQISFSLTEAGSMLEDLLDAVTLHKRKKIPLEITQFNLEDLILEAVHEARLKGSVILYQTTHISGFWSRSAMKRALINLLTNAQKYSSENTSITVNSSIFEERLLLSVHNQGKPIPKESIGAIFQHLHRLSDLSTAGWGVGLPLVQLVAESHGGVALVDSDKLRGTTFSMNLPLDSRQFSEPIYKVV